VVYGLAHADYAGKGIAAGLSIVLLGILIDRVTRAAADRETQAAHTEGASGRRGLRALLVGR
jgi:glycine betaine/proline transport system permease protein